MSAKVYIEGGGDSKDLRIRCREGFRQLFKKCGFGGRMPRLVACGGREATFDDFNTAHSAAADGDYVAMLVDSEEPVDDIERPWQHLKGRDGWSKPAGADDDQALLMTTCMETWLAADRQALSHYYGTCVQVSALPPLRNIESRERAAILQALAQATRTCKRAYAKGRASFEIVARLDPHVLQQHLPSFARCKRALERRL